MLMNLLASIFFTLAVIIEYIGMAIIVIATVMALYKLPKKEFTQDNLRAQLARNIMFGLEFIIAADILLLTISTGKELTELLQLGAAVVIRILLGYALKKENLK